MIEITEATPALTAGLSAAELEVMREAAARLGGTGDPFGALAAPFCPAPTGTRANYHRSGGHLWCHGTMERL